MTESSGTTDDLVIGVLGGMGPEATADFLSKLVAATPVEKEQDHLRVLIDCNPKVPDRNGAIAGRSESAGPTLAAMAAGLERAGANFLVMACNTAHAFETDIRDAVDIPFVSMIDEAGASCARAIAPEARVGLLAAQGCLDARLYQQVLERHGFRPVVLDPASQRVFMAILGRIKRGDLSAAAKEAMRTLGRRLVDEGAEAVIAACTEVPLVLLSSDLPVPLFDPTAHLAARCVRYARHLEPLPQLLPFDV